MTSHELARKLLEGPDVLVEMTGDHMSDQVDGLWYYMGVRKPAGSNIYANTPFVRLLGWDEFTNDL